MTKIQISKLKINKGFTLVEILMAIAVAGLIGGAIITIYPAVKKGYEYGEIRTDVNQNARLAIGRICREIKATAEIVTILPAAPSTPSTATIIFRDQAAPIHYITYYLNGTDLKRKVTHYHLLPDTTTQVAWSPTAQETVERDDLMAQNITFLDFWGQTQVFINLTASSSGISIPLTTACWPRNR
jgi:prepilin-type N-terminal cleavage/methylation domain-containing protein